VELVGIAPTSSETQTSGTPCSGYNLSLIPESPKAGIFRNELSVHFIQTIESVSLELSLCLSFFKSPRLRAQKTSLNLIRQREVEP